MIFGLFKRRGDPVADPLYASIVAQARQPVFYLDFAVADTLDGRFDMIVLHLALVIARLKEGDEAARGAARDVAETFFADMDRSLREMGIADLKVPKKVREMANAFYGRLTAYEEALATEGADRLAEALNRNIYAGENHPCAAALAGYVRDSADRLAGLPAGEVARATALWLDPQPYSPQGEVS